MDKLTFSLKEKILYGILIVFIVCAAVTDCGPEPTHNPISHELIF